ncbi:hypothetical protein niasHT_019983 [Heterodera trifolii]|uniref:Uncharacterized protein n=1 Tax=Heterodera trifolii TaxID=157864 RepID=A0ABD2LIH1_9BILA
MSKLKKATDANFPEDAEERNIAELYELMRQNRRARTPELVWEQLLNSVGLGLFQVDSTREEEEGGEGREENGEEDSANEGTHVIRCRQM